MFCRGTLLRAIWQWRQMKSASEKPKSGPKICWATLPMSPDSPPLRGEVWWVMFDPSIGGEIRKMRPAVIVSNDIANRTMNRVPVVPLTSNVGRLYPSEAYVTLRGEQRKAMADQLSTVSKRRLRDRLSRLDHADIAAIERVI